MEPTTRSLLQGLGVLSLLLAFAAALVLSILSTYYVRKWAVQVGAVDVPDGRRRLHTHPIPRLGGVAVFGSVAIVLGTGWVLGITPALNVPENQTLPVLALIGGSAAIFLLGLWDDVRRLGPWRKAAFEALVATAVFAAGVRVEGLGVPDGSTLIFPIWLSLVLTVAWIVGITNAFNLIDGSDGIAGGAALFASSSIAVVSLLSGNHLSALVALTLAGATLGFLFFNFPPASIFLGDSGSLFIGFALGTLGVLTTQTAPTTLAVAIPVISFGLPILDTLLAMVRRFLRGESIFNADRGHIHHRLSDLGHSPRKVALLLYGASAAFALVSLLLVAPYGAAAATVLIVGGAVLWIAVQRLRIPELLEVGRIMQRGLLQRSVIANNVRLREAVHRLESALTPDQLLSVVADALNGGEFERIELLLDRNVAAPLERCADVETLGSTLRWTRNGATFGKPLWELRLPFNDFHGQQVGCLSLWRSRDGEHLLTDLRLIALEFQPAFMRALAGIARTDGLRVSAAPLISRRPEERSAPSTESASLTNISSASAS